ncbi:hypothetical protein [Streptomyces sp. NBC_00280]|uniref:hypothetical protein n=1 Tax=Streptomyces sp. NBC_00280 TaxID=2975699 RepID=UPI0032461C19
MSRSHQSRTLTVLAATAFAAAVVPVLGAGTASATTGGSCQSATVQYRIDGGEWTSQGGFHSLASAPGTVEVRLAPAQNVGEGCKYPVSLAEYTTEGPNWNTSGRQTFIEKDTVYLTSADVADAGGAERTWQKLSVKTPDCYGQIDLYGDDIAYDGQEGEGHGPAPYQPDGVVTPYHLIAAWNGGDKACDNGASEPPAPTPSEPAPSTPATPTAPPTTPEGSEPPVEESTPPTTPDTSTTPPTTPDVPPAESTPPTSPEPSPSESTPPLAETGAGAPVGTIAGVAAAVVALGAGALFLSRRARRS